MSAASEFINRRTNKEIKFLLDECIDGQRDRFPGKTYEDGVVYAFLWLFIETAEHPLLIDAHIEPMLHNPAYRALKDSALSRREEIERPLREEILKLRAGLSCAQEKLKPEFVKSNTVREYASREFDRVIAPHLQIPKTQDERDNMVAMKKVREALALMNSMILSGESHSDASRKAYEEAMNELYPTTHEGSKTMIAPEKDPPQIDNAFSALEHVLDSLEKSMEEHRQKLAPVLSPPRAGGTDRDIDKLKRVALAPMAERLELAGGRINRLDLILEDLSERLEVSDDFRHKG